MRRDKLRAPTALSVSRAMNTLIEGAYWPASLATRIEYARRHDDTDGQTGHDQNLSVMVGPDGDCWLRAGEGNVLRFRTYAGGGQSMRVRNALLVLAEAIQRDNEERPQRAATQEPHP